jgi:dihydrofolate reductase
MPRAQATKQLLLRKADIGAIDITFVAADFEIQDWLERLVEVSFDPHQPAVLLSEGVIMYLRQCGQLCVRLGERPMSRVIWHVTMSLDGFIAGPDDSMGWVVSQWSDGGVNTRDIEVERSAVADEVLRSAGAILGGRRWYDLAVRRFDGYDGIYGGQWKGPVFVLTHRPPDGDHHPAITFLSVDLSDAVATATSAAAGKALIIFGASVAVQCLRAGLLDEIVIHLVPVLLGDGVRLIDTPDLGPIALERTLVASSGQITDLRFAVRRSS